MGGPRIDRPQRTSSVPPALYGFVPRTDCGRRVGALPAVLVERLQHYFTAYKLVPGEESKVSLESVYGRQEALRVVQASMDDYAEEYPD